MRWAVSAARIFYMLRKRSALGFPAPCQALNLRAESQAIDARNYKASLKLCKDARTPLVLSLKALTLCRLGKHEECSQLCERVLPACAHAGLTSRFFLSSSVCSLERLHAGASAPFSRAPRERERERVGSRHSLGR